MYTLSRGGGDIQQRIENIQPPDPDQTIEILMTELNPEIMSIFTKDECSKAKEATERSGIHKIIPGMIIDDYLFEPCGYSMNGISKTNVSTIYLYQIFVVYLYKKNYKKKTR